MGCLGIGPREIGGLSIAESPFIMATDAAETGILNPAGGFVRGHREGREQSEAALNRASQPELGPTGVY